jgi:hypothetical protein
MFEIISAVLFLLLVISVLKNVQLGMTLLRVEDSLEECLDVIDKHFAHMSEILKRPLFLDSPEVKAVVKDIKEVRNALHRIAYVLSQNVQDEEGIADQTKEN